MPNFDILAHDYITRRFEFDAAHRVYGHKGKCRYLHGHRYRAEVSLLAPQLDALGMVFDFGILKTLIGKWIDDNWDHNILLHQDDPLAQLWKTYEESGEDDSAAGTHYINQAYEIFEGKAPFIMPPHARNPTAENIARVLMETNIRLIQEYTETEESAEDLTFHIHNVRIYETPNCWADYSTL